MDGNSGESQPPILPPAEVKVPTPEEVAATANSSEIKTGLEPEVKPEAGDVEGGSAAEKHPDSDDVDLTDSEIAHKIAADANLTSRKQIVSKEILANVTPMDMISRQVGQQPIDKDADPIFRSLQKENFNTDPITDLSKVGGNLTNDNFEPAIDKFKHIDPSIKLVGKEVYDNGSGLQAIDKESRGVELSDGSLLPINTQKLNFPLESGNTDKLLLPIDKDPLPAYDTKLTNPVVVGGSNSENLPIKKPDLPDGPDGVLPSAGVEAAQASFREYDKTQQKPLEVNGTPDVSGTSFTDPNRGIGVAGPKTPDHGSLK
jgi:hypothetical protein